MSATSENHQHFDLEPVARVRTDFDVDELEDFGLLLPTGFFNYHELYFSDFQVEKVHRWRRNKPTNRQLALRAFDLSSISPSLPAETLPLPTDDQLADSPSSLIRLKPGQEITLGRSNNPDRLPLLDRKTISGEHFKLRLELGERGLRLAVVDHASKNGSYLASYKPAEDGEMQDVYRWLEDETAQLQHRTTA